MPYLKNGKLEGVPEGQLPPPIPGATQVAPAAATSPSVPQPQPLGLSSSGLALPTMVSTVLTGPPIPPPPQVTTQQLQQHLLAAQHQLMQQQQQLAPGTPQGPVRPSDTAASALNDLRSALLSPGQQASDETMIGLGALSTSQM